MLVELPKTQTEHNEPTVEGSLTLQYAELRLLELYYNFFLKVCDVDKLEELEKGTDSLSLALAKQEFEDCI